ncbi:MAG: glycoside hydrolase, partial [Gammaproteobacteria bacterium]|nr:glycoside hydrolase [Gammaproteobacteria bacterium]
MSFRIQSGAALSAAFLGFVASSVMLLSATAWGQGIPGQSVNIIGPTPDIDYMLPDTGLKQQDEVHCSVRPGDSLVAFCGYNDYRTTELTDDAWVGSSMTRDGGLTWMSRVNPGWPLYNVGAGPIGHDFAADPTTVAVPGLVLYNFIAADRGKKGTGGLFLQRWFESDKENGFPYLPSQDTTLITKGTSCPQCSGRFIDKPHMIATLAGPGSGRAPVNVSGTLEDGTTKSVTVPAGELHVVYSVFTGSKQTGSKILLSVSTDWGTTWSVDSKITESVGVNQSAHLVANGNKLLVVWRRFDDTNESNALMFSNSFDRGQTWAPPAVLQELACPYDQPTANNMFRTTVHPVAATDGSKYFVFWSQRGMDGAIGTTPEYQCQFGL